MLTESDSILKVNFKYLLSLKTGKGNRLKCSGTAQNSGTSAGKVSLQWR